jgi:hypothetical protein
MFLNWQYFPHLNDIRHYPIFTFTHIFLFIHVMVYTIYPCMVYTIINIPCNKTIFVLNASNSAKNGENNVNV